jgi:tetratricopeptide (TPR) repeat protein
MSSVRRLLLPLLLLSGCHSYREAMHPSDERGHVLRAEALLAAHALDEARIEARFAVALKPRDGAAWGVLARIERAAGRPGLALLAVERAAERAPAKPDWGGLRAELRAEREQQLAALAKLDGGALAAGGGAVEPRVAQAVRSWEAQGAHQRAIEAVLDWVGAEPALHTRGPAGLRLLESVGERAAALELAAPGAGAAPLRERSWRPGAAGDRRGDLDGGGPPGGDAARGRGARAGGTAARGLRDALADARLRRAGGRAARARRVPGA